MLKRTAILMRGFITLFGAIMIAAGCKEAVDSEDPNPKSPLGTSIALDQRNGTFATGTPMGSGTHMGKGFTPLNPHLGDAIVVTFFWRGSSNVITKVEDHLADGTMVGNTYTLVEYVTGGGISMATYLASNVQNFPDPNPGESTVLDVHAITSTPVTGDGILLSSYRGVASPNAVALGQHRSSVGTGSTVTTVAPGAVAVSLGSLAYGVSVSNRTVGFDPPLGFAPLAWISDTITVANEVLVMGTIAGTINPEWRWYFTANAPGAGLATILSLVPAAP